MGVGYGISPYGVLGYGDPIEPAPPTTWTWCPSHWLKNNISATIPENSTINDLWRLYCYENINALSREEMATWHVQDLMKWLFCEDTLEDFGTVSFNDVYREWLSQKISAGLININDKAAFLYGEF